MLPNTFSGKILLQHPVGHTILSSEVTTAITSKYTDAQIRFHKFGISKLINVGVLYGTLKQENRQALTSYLEAAISKQGNTCNIPVRVTWDSIYANGESPTSVEAIFIKCRIEDVVQATRVLSQLYGSTAADWDPLRPLMRFIPMATLKSSEPVTLQVTVRQKQFLHSTCIAILKNTQPLERQIKIPQSNKTVTLAALFQSLKDTQDAALFHTVVSNMNRPNQILLGSKVSHANHVKAIQKDAMAILKTSYLWLMASDVFEQSHENTVLIKQIKDLSITQGVQAEKMIDELFLDWDNYPSLSEDDAGSTSKVSTSRVHARGAWKLGAPSTDSKHTTQSLKPLRTS